MAKEVRLIDANDAVRLLRGKCVAKYPSTFLMGLLAAAAEVEKAPTVDAVEVVHGRWELIEKAGVDYWCCSACGKIRSEYYYKPKDNYCPNCGAKMDGEGSADK